MKLTIQLAILTLVTISLAACFNSSKTRYRNTPGPVTEREPERETETPTTPKEFGDNIFGTIAASVGLATVTRVQRHTGQTITADADFNPHQSARSYAQRQYTIGAAGSRNPSALAIRTEAQLYPRDGGNPMLFAATGASTLEFPSRGDVFRGVAIHSSEDHYQGAANGRLTIQGFTPQSGDWWDWENKVLTSFQFDDDNSGIIMNFGADSGGGAVFSDLGSYRAKDCDTTDRNCNAPASHDISIAFAGNRHENAATGGLAYYWQALVPNYRLDKDGSVLVPGETITSVPNPHFITPGPSYDVTEDVGTYTLELTHAATGTADSANEDAQRYLSYAVYGLFNFFDKDDPPTGLEGAVRRMQTISYGLDAFAGTSNMSTTDLTNNIAATFKGRTIAYLLHVDDDGFANERDVTALTRMRGDIQLTANIGPNAGSGGEAANSITGTISGLEYSTPRQSPWSNSNLPTAVRANTENFSFATAFGGAAVLNLTGGTIDAAGGYTGTVTPSTGPATYFVNGAFKGNLYGPLTGLETAGTWYLPAKEAPWSMGVAGVIGSFGACQDDKGRC